MLKSVVVLFNWDDYRQADDFCGVFDSVESVKKYLHNKELINGYHYTEYYVNQMLGENPITYGERNHVCSDCNGTRVDSMCDMCSHCVG